MERDCSGQIGPGFSGSPERSLDLSGPPEKDRESIIQSGGVICALLLRSKVIVFLDGFTWDAVN